MASYTALYAVPKKSFDNFIKYKMGVFPNVKKLNVDQLNFNEAKKLNAVYQNETETEKKEKEQGKGLFLKNNSENDKQTNIYRNGVQRLGHRLGEEEKTNFAYTKREPESESPPPSPPPPPPFRQNNPPEPPPRWDYTPEPPGPRPKEETPSLHEDEAGDLNSWFENNGFVPAFSSSSRHSTPKRNRSSSFRRKTGSPDDAYAKGESSNVSFPRPSSERKVVASRENAESSREGEESGKKKKQRISFGPGMSQIQTPGKAIDFAGRALKDFKEKKFIQQNISSSTNDSSKEKTPPSRKKTKKKKNNREPIDNNPSPVSKHTRTRMAGSVSVQKNTAPVQQNQFSTYRSARPVPAPINVQERAAKFGASKKPKKQK